MRTWIFGCLVFAMMSPAASEAKLECRDFAGQGEFRSKTVTVSKWSARARAYQIAVNSAYEQAFSFVREQICIDDKNVCQVLTGPAEGCEQGYQNHSYGAGSAKCTVTLRACASPKNKVKEIFQDQVQPITECEKEAVRIGRLKAVEELNVQPLYLARMEYEEHPQRRPEDPRSRFYFGFSSPGSEIVSRKVMITVLVASGDVKDQCSLESPHVISHYE